MAPGGVAGKGMPVDSKGVNYPKLAAYAAARYGPSAGIAFCGLRRRRGFLGNTEHIGMTEKVIRRLQEMSEVSNKNRSLPHHRDFAGGDGLIMGWLLAVSMLVLLGCSSRRTPAPDTVLPQQGKAVILTMHPNLGYAVVRSDDGTHIIWWDQRSLFFYNGQQSKTLLAKPGDTVHFDGLAADGEVYIGTAWLGPEPVILTSPALAPPQRPSLTTRPDAVERPP